MDLDEAIRRFRGPLIGLIASWGAPVGEAAELAEESFAEAYFNRESCRGDLGDSEVCGRWLRGVARNRFRNWRRSKTRRERRVAAVDPATLASHAAPDGTVSDARIEQLRAAIERLPTKQRRVVLMHYLEDTSVADVAALLSVTPKAVEGRLYQARKALTRMLTPSASALDTEARRS